MSEPIPERADVRQLRTQAKELLQSLQSGETTAEGIDPATAKLADAQRLIARKHGYASWPKLIDEVETPILLAKLAKFVGMGDAEKLENLLKSKPALRKKIDTPIFPFDSPAIVTAAGRDHAEKILPILVKYGADPNVRTSWWAGSFSPLDSAKGKAVDVLLNLGAKFDVWSASAHGRLDVLKDILAKDPSRVNAPGGDGETPLHFASTPEIAEFLIAHGADLERRDIDHESTPIQYQAKKPEIMRVLLRHGAKPDVYTAVVLNDPDLLNQVLADDSEALNSRIGEGRFATTKSQGGHIYDYVFGPNKTPQQVAAETGHMAILNLLLKDASPGRRLASAVWLEDKEEAARILRTHPNIATEMGADARIIADAAQAGKTETVRLLLEAGVDPTVTGFGGGSALHTACWYGQIGPVNLLADVVPLDSLDAHFGSPPLGWATHGSQWCRNPAGDYVGVVERLIQAGADPLAPANRGGDSMLQQAGDREDVKEVLRRYGAR